MQDVAQRPGRCLLLLVDHENHPFFWAQEAWPCSAVCKTAPVRGGARFAGCARDKLAARRRHSASGMPMIQSELAARRDPPLI